jgi:hypothetical protein
MSARAGSRLGEKIDALMEQAQGALERGGYFECEYVADEALRLAHRARDFERMARILLPLEEARRQRRLDAVDSGKLYVLNTQEQLNEPVRTGCYLIEPILVGADGRDLRERALETETPVLVVVHEPRTQMGDWPLVAVGPVTIRARVAQPKKVTVAWVLAASEAIGDEAIETVDEATRGEDLVDELYDRLQSVPDHDKLHQALMRACKDALQALPQVG